MNFDKVVLLNDRTCEADTITKPCIVENGSTDSVTLANEVA